MSVIIGIEQLSKDLSAEQLENLDAAAAIHSTQSNIEFSILKVEGDTVHIESAQFENRSGRYATEATLLKKTHEVFDKWLPGYNLAVQVSAFLASPVSVVTVEWIEMKMKDKEVRIKQIAFDTGVSRESIANWVGGKRAMSQIVKAMFYFYLSK